jgi:response regulator RpfG family c-di-GMP phosphodiesterase
MSKPKVLLVDDEPNILTAYERNLRLRFDIDTALGSMLGLEAVAQKGPYAVIVSDMRMPIMDGVQFLAAVKEKTPDSVRIMLTGNADLETAIQVVNQGNIFRFLTKPCPIEVLAKALDDGAHQHHLITAERELLEKTFSGAIRVLAEILSMVDPRSFDQAMTLRDLSHTMADTLELKQSWDLTVAAMLSQIGNVTIPGSVLSKARKGEPLTDTETAMLNRLPHVSRDLLANIPRLETVANIVYYQNKCFDGQGFPQDPVARENIPLGARILKVLSDLMKLGTDPANLPKAFAVLRSRAGWYDPKVLDAAYACFVQRGAFAAPTTKQPLAVGVNDLLLGQILLSDVETADGVLLIAAGHTISNATLERIKNFARLSGIKEPILVENPAPAA